jgi:peptidyl-prolyl cis-trans isomerase SurA
MRKLLLTAACATAAGWLNAQTLFTYGKHPVSKQEFLYAFNKNPSEEKDRRQALETYLKLYQQYKLKVQAAYDAGLDKQEAFDIEASNFRKQLADNMINDEAGIDKLVHEAFVRGQKDIFVQQVFVENNGTDTLAAYQAAQDIFKLLQQGKKTTDAVQAGTKEGVKVTANEVGYVTVFTLPYVFENAVYDLKPGQYSKPVKAAGGYVILKNVSERPAAGKVNVAQILLAYPPNPSEEVKNQLRQTADSIYQWLRTGKATFSDMVKQYSNDRSTVGRDGVLDMFGVGTYQTVFEDKAFALKQKGDVSLPFETSYGLHILQLIEKKPVATNETEAAEQPGGLKQQVQNDNRLQYNRNNLFIRWRTLSGYKPAAFSKPDLWNFCDTFYQTGRKITSGAVGEKTVLFSFTKQPVTALDFALYVRALRSAAGTKKVTDLAYENYFQNYIVAATQEYYTNHYQEFNEKFRNQVKEFDDANLLFAVMEKEVWNKAAADTAELLNYYHAHTGNYQWQPSLCVINFYAVSEAQATEIAGKVKQMGVQKWREIISGYDSNQVMADSNRYEYGQLPVKNIVDKQPGFVSTPERSMAENNYIFVAVAEVHDKPEPRNFNDAKGMVVTDYQQVLEKAFIDSLYKKYPVKVDAKVWATVK